SRQLPHRHEKAAGPIWWRRIRSLPSSTHSAQEYRGARPRRNHRSSAFLPPFFPDHKGLHVSLRAMTRQRKRPVAEPRAFINLSGVSNYANSKRPAAPAEIAGAISAFFGEWAPLPAL